MWQLPIVLFLTLSSFPFVWMSTLGWGMGRARVRLFILFCRHVSVSGLYELREGISVILSKVQQSYEVLIIISIFMLMSLRHSGYLINLNKATEPENGKLGNLALNPCSQWLPPAACADLSCTTALLWGASPVLLSQSQLIFCKKRGIILCI